MSSSLRIMHILAAPAAGGAEVYVRDLCIQLTTCGHQVYIAFLENAADSGKDAAYEFKFLQELKAAGVSYGFIGTRARRNPLWGWWRLRKLAGAFQPDVLHAHLFYGLLFSYRAAKSVIYTHHSNQLRVPKWFYRLILDHLVSTYVGICSACYVALSSVVRKPVAKIDNGVDASRLRQKAHGALTRTIKMLAVGRLTTQKNYPRLLEALSLLPDDFDWRLDIAGEGPLREAMETLSKKLGLSSRVDFLGAVRDVPERMAKADLFVMSSDWEGLPIALIEATLTGLPVIVTNVGGCAEVVHACCNGIVVDEPTVDALRGAIHRMLEDSELRASCSMNAVKYGARYELGTSLKKHLVLYQNVAGIDSAKVS